MRRSALAVLLALSTTLASAQNRQIILRPASVQVSHEFSRIGSVRELADGRLLVTDVGDGELLVVDIGTGAARPVATKGAGPGEFRDLGRLIALGADSTIMADRGNRRALVLHVDRVTATRATDDPIIAALGADLVGADTLGRLFGLRGLPPADYAATPRRDLVAVIAFDRRLARIDTVAVLRAVELHTQLIGTPPRQTMRTSTALMSSSEQAAVFPDGEVAVVLQDPYRVEWHSRMGGVRRAPPLERTSAPIDEAEKLAWKRRTEEWSGQPLSYSLDRFPWAATVPPFRQGALTPLPDGNLLIAREPWSGDSRNSHDVVDRAGRRIGTLVLSASSRVVGTGRGSVFLAVADDDGIERIHRHVWP